MELSEFLLWFIAWGVIGGGIGAAIGSSKGQGPAGFWLGALLGFIGWIVVAVMEPSDEIRQTRAQELARALGGEGITPPGESADPVRVCPWCAERIKAAATVCRFCSRDLPPISSKNEDTSDDEDLSGWLESKYPRRASEALDVFGSLTTKPENPKEWLGELCRRIDNGSDGFAAASKIPLTYPKN